MDTSSIEFIFDCLYSLYSNLFDVITCKITSNHYNFFLISYSARKHDNPIIIIIKNVNSYYIIQYLNLLLIQKYIFIKI